MPHTVEKVRWTRWLDWVLPNFCLACREERASTPLGLCIRCSEKLQPKDSDPCLLCGRPVPGLTHEPCGPCRLKPPPWQELIWLYPYTSPVTEVIAHLKFRRLFYLARPLGEALGNSMSQGDLSADLVLSVPTPWLRRVRRGLDVAREIAMGVSNVTGIPYTNALTRSFGSTPQKGKDRGHRLRLSPLEIRVHPRIAGQTILLVDDVITTGGTLRACTTALKRAGATSVITAVVGRTPSPGEFSQGE